RSQQGTDIQAELPAKVEYLAVQYLSRAYVGSFETAREQPDTYLGQDERRLVPAIDAQINSLDSSTNPAAVAKLKTRWGSLKKALEDMNSGNNSFNTASGRPFAPIMVDLHARNLSNQWMNLEPRNAGLSDRVKTTALGQAAFSHCLPCPGLTARGDIPVAGRPSGGRGP